MLSYILKTITLHYITLNVNFCKFYTQNISDVNIVRQLSSINTDKKENQIFLIYKEIQSGAVAKSYMRIGRAS